MSESQPKDVASFYDEYWPRNIPNYRKTIEHIFSLLPKKQFYRALDAGCGSGVCSIALSQIAKEVSAIDISQDCIRSAKNLADSLGINNIQFLQANVLELPFENDSFDLVLSWGVIHHTVDPLSALDELVRVCKPGGTVILAIYLKTNLTFIHELIRKSCLKMRPKTKKLFISFMARLVKLFEILGKKTNVRDDNITIESQVEDWFFVPIKFFFSIEEITREFFKRGLRSKILYDHTGRFKSSSNFIIQGFKNE